MPWANLHHTRRGKEALLLQSSDLVVALSGSTGPQSEPRSLGRCCRCESRRPSDAPQKLSYRRGGALACAARAAVLQRAEGEHPGALIGRRSNSPPKVLSHPEAHLWAPTTAHSGKKWTKFLWQLNSQRNFTKIGIRIQRILQNNLSLRKSCFCIHKNFEVRYGPYNDIYTGNVD